MATDKPPVPCFIYARSGSERLRNKHMERVGTRNLLGWAIWLAQVSARVGDVILTTDCAAMRREARLMWMAKPRQKLHTWERPASLADEATVTGREVYRATLDRWRDTMPRWEGEITAHLDANVMRLDGTCLDRTVEALEAAPDARRAEAVSTLPHGYAEFARRMGPDGLLYPVGGSWVDASSKTFPPTYFEVSIARAHRGRITAGPCVGVVVDPWSWAHIHDSNDLEYARWLWLRWIRCGTRGTDGP